MPSTAAGTAVSTIGDLIDENMTMWAHCPNGHSRAVDLNVLAKHYGRAASYIKGETPIRIKCARCGARCEQITIAAR